MNPNKRAPSVSETFPQAFDKARFRNFALNLLNHFDEAKAFTANSTLHQRPLLRTHVHRFERLALTPPGAR